MQHLFDDDFDVGNIKMMQSTIDMSRGPSLL